MVPQTVHGLRLGPITFFQLKRFGLEMFVGAWINKREMVGREPWSSGYGDDSHWMDIFSH